MRKYNTDPEYKKLIDEDKRARAAAQRKADPPISLFDIVIPLAPFGIPGTQQTSFHAFFIFHVLMERKCLTLSFCWPDMPS